MTSRLSTKGQLIIPKEIRDRHGWTPGIELVLEDRGDCLVLRPVAEYPPVSLDDLVGCAGYHGPAHTLEEMEDAIAEGSRRSR
jgi:AbrB family looped-hinge helix DNA binding protein